MHLFLLIKFLFVYFIYNHTYHSSPSLNHSLSLVAKCISKMEILSNIGLLLLICFN